MISAWSKTRDKRSPLKAEELIDLMESLYGEDAKKGIASPLAPQSQAYTVRSIICNYKIQHPFY